MDNNYIVKVYGKDGKIVATLKDASINTVYRALPFMIEDALLRGQGTGEWDIYGEELWEVTETSFIGRIRSNFETTLWFDELSNDGEATILTIKVKMEHQ